MERTPTTTAAAGSSALGVQSSQFSDLPPVLLTRILQRLPQQERLSSCATVCTAWATAAAAATGVVDLSDATANAIPSFQAWVEQHAGQLGSLSLKLRTMEATHFYGNFQPPNFTLPWSHLHQLSRLDLAGVKLQLGNAMDAKSSSSTATAAMLPKLKALKLQDCFNLHALPQLTQLSGLTRLKLVWCLRGRWADLESQTPALQPLLQGLPKLAHLSLGCPADLRALVQALPANSLTALTWSMERPSTLQELPSSISRLVNLRKLKLGYGNINLEVLSNMTLLTHLQLLDFQMSGGSASVFLAAVRGMRQLQHLSVVSEASPLNLGVAQPRDCAALTAAGQLTHLELMSYEEQPLPAAAVQHMFPSGKQFPQLQELSISSFDFDQAAAGRVTTAELHAIISACPALCALNIRCVLADDVDVSVLLQLPATCCSLKVGGKPFGDSAAGLMAQLTQLTSLEWDFAPDLTDVGLQLLTDLSRLHTFQMTGNDGLSDVVEKEEGAMVEALELTCVPGMSVSQQLHELLLSTPTSAAWLTRVEQQQQKIADQQDRLHALSCFTAQLAYVLMFCAGNKDTMVAVRRMADIGLSLLVGGDVVEGGEGGRALQLQRYLQLQGRALESCAGIGIVPVAFASMEAAVKRAAGG